MSCHQDNIISLVLFLLWGWQNGFDFHLYLFVFNRMGLDLILMFWHWSLFSLWGHQHWVWHSSVQMASSPYFRLLLQYVCFRLGNNGCGLPLHMSKIHVNLWCIWFGFGVGNNGLRFVSADCGFSSSGRARAGLMRMRAHESPMSMLMELSWASFGNESLMSMRMEASWAQTAT